MTHLGNILGLALQGIFTNGLWPARAKDNIQAPYGVFFYFGPERNFLAGPAVDQNKTVQIDCWDTTSSGAENLADAVQTAMLAHSLDSSPSMFTSTPLSRQLEIPDPDTKLQRVILEFSVWYRP